MLVWEALFPVVIINLGYALPIILGLVDQASTEDGADHYAERAVTFLSHLFPGITMPLNTLVNLGYMLVGLVSLLRVWRREKDVSPTHAYCCYVFCWLSVVYGPIQLTRILSQSHRWALADQLVTLPMFSWVGSWGMSVYSSWSTLCTAVITSLSLASFFLTLISPVGFEMALSVHIVGAVVVGLVLLRTFPSPSANRAFILAVICCAGFVVFKLLDHHLASMHDIFTIVSGHFLSKIADFMQIYYVIEFFHCVAHEKEKKVKIG